MADGRDHRSNDFRKIEGSKTTVYKYLTELIEEEKLIDKTAGEKRDSFRPIYKITDKGIKTYNKIKTINDFSKYLEGLNVEQIKLLAYAFMEMMDTPDEVFFVFKNFEARWIPTTPELKQVAENAWREKEEWANKQVAEALKRKTSS